MDILYNQNKGIRSHIMLTVKGKFDGQNIKILESIPFNEESEVLIIFLQQNIPSIKKKGDWRKLRGSARGTNLTNALLISRKKDLLNEK